MTANVDAISEALPGYEIGGELGRGGMGTVRAGRHRQLGRDVAIKELPDVVSADAVARARFVSEARVLASLDHPHIVPIYDYVERDGVCLLVMEALPGGTIWSRFKDVGFTHEAACGVALVTCAALHHAHQHGVLHRDVKPENLLYAANGQVKVTDFGIAKVIGGDDTLATSAGQIIGSPAYIAPEQANGDDLGPPADVFATGVMLYELLSGHLPYSEEGGALSLMYRHVYEDAIPIRNFAPNVDPRIAEVVMRSLARLPADRYPSSEAFGVDLALAAVAVWGIDWLDRGGTSLMAGGPIAESATRETASSPALAPPNPPASAGETLPSAQPPPPAQALPSAQPPPPMFGEVLPEPPPAFGPRPVVPDQLPPPAVQPPPPAVPPPVAEVVRPQVDSHIAGAQEADLGDDDLMPVSSVLVVPRAPVVHWLVAAILFVVTLGLASVGLGVAEPVVLDGTSMSVAGMDVSDGGEATIDVAAPVEILVTERPPEVQTATRVAMELSILGLPAQRTPAAELVMGPNGVAAATVDLSGSKYLLAGQMDAAVLFEDPNGGVLGTQEFTVSRTGSSWVTVPGGLVVAGLLMVLAYAEAGLRPLRRKNRHSIFSLIRMAVVGGAFGVLIAAAAWIAGMAVLSPTTLIVCMIPGALLGITVALATLQSARRRRVKRARAA